MSNLRQAAEQALEALEWSKPHADASVTYEEAISALIEALAEPPQEPICPECTAKVLYECVACSRSNYPPQRKRFDILAITTAYEQGVGKGHQAHGRSVEIENPYAPGECKQAWALGYDEGKKQASPKVPHGTGEKYE